MEPFAPNSFPGSTLVFMFFLLSWIILLNRGSNIIYISSISFSAYFHFPHIIGEENHNLCCVFFQILPKLGALAEFGKKRNTDYDFPHQLYAENQNHREANIRLHSNEYWRNCRHKFIKDQYTRCLYQQKSGQSKEREVISCGGEREMWANISIRASGHVCSNEKVFSESGTRRGETWTDQVGSTKCTKKWIIWLK